jgi:hypothetical protein
MTRESVLQSSALLSQKMAELAAEIRDHRFRVKPIGRPTAAARASQQQIIEAPFPEMATEPADRLCALIRQMTDSDKLSEAHLFEQRYLRRKSVLAEIERRSRLLGRPVGLDLLPISDYDELEEVEIIARLSTLSAEELVVILVYEQRNYRRPGIVERTEELIASKPQASEPEPFPGYLQLKTSPQSRAEVRQALETINDSELDAALGFERSTKNRRVMLDFIARERLRRLRQRELDPE